MKYLIASIFLVLSLSVQADETVLDLIESEKINAEAHYHSESNNVVLCYMYEDRKGGYCGKPMAVNDLEFCLFNDLGQLIDCWAQGNSI